MPKLQMFLYIINVVNDYYFIKSKVNGGPKCEPIKIC